MYSFYIYYYNNGNMDNTVFYLLDRFMYFADALGIDNPATKKTAADGICYDLQGRRINSNALTRGVYIHNSKKRLVK